jgi:ElaB/YqjD/DUF883 family membrane-anchored ribosome-binding protein
MAETAKRTAAKGTAAKGTAAKATAAKGATAKKSESRNPEQIEREIEQTREELADSVAAVTDKADVKKQAKRKVDETKSRAREKVEGLKGTVRSMKDDLAGGGQPATAGASEGPTPVERASEFARENPTIIAVAGAVLAGVVIGRISAR